MGGEGFHQAAGMSLNALQMGSDSVILHQPLFVCAGLIPEVLDNQPLEPLDVLMPRCRTHIPSHCGGCRSQDAGKGEGGGWARGAEFDEAVLEEHKTLTACFL